MPTSSIGIAPSVETRDKPDCRLAVVMKGYPRLSETFIAQELLSLQRRGIRFVIYSLRRPTDAKEHPVHAAITAPRRYLPEYLYQAPLRVLNAWWRIRNRSDLKPGYLRARSAWLRDLRRDPTPNRARRWGQALVLAEELPAEIRHLYVHFLHTPASVTRYAAMIRGLTWSTSAHAKDIYTIPDWEKAEKIAGMAWLTTCTAANVTHLKELAGPHAGKIELLYHGLDLARFGKPARTRDTRDGTDPAQPVRLLSVGRAVEKKGYDVLLDALSLLPPNLAWRLTHIGGGELRSALESQAKRLGLTDQISWQGARTQEDVLAQYRQADIFVLASRIAADGDRDGLPNVLMEAQSQGVACVSTTVSGVPELIRDGETGCLVAPGDAKALAAALEGLIRDSARRTALGEAGAARVRIAFDHETAIDKLADRLRAHIEEPAASVRR
jgi:glycosyltransferase involved in cell wall biosynthesis